MNVFQDIFQVIDFLVKKGMVASSVGLQQKQLLLSGCCSINPKIRKHYKIDSSKNCYVVEDKKP